MMKIFIYIAVAEKDDIRDLYRRKAEIRRDDTILRSYVPPQFYARFQALNRVCRERREQDADFKNSD